MDLVTLYRDGSEAIVDKHIKETYENFLAHGWSEKAETPAKVEEGEQGEAAPIRSTRKATSKTA